MSAEHVLRKASEQAFTLYARSLHPELFTIYVEREIYRDAYASTFWIIGSSHVVTFRAGGRVLSEVLADAKQELPVQMRIASFKFGHNPQKRFRYEDGIAYDAQFDYQTFDRRGFLDKVREIRHSLLPNGVIQVFPARAPGDDAGVPGDRPVMPTLTAVSFVPRDRSLNVRTFHTFPEEMVIIETHSRWEVRYGR